MLQKLFNFTPNYITLDVSVCKTKDKKTFAKAGTETVVLIVRQKTLIFIDDHEQLVA